MQGNGLRAYLARYIGKFLPRASGGYRHLPRVLHQSEIVVVDGDGDVALGVLRQRGRGQQAGNQQQRTHDKLPPDGREELVTSLHTMSRSELRSEGKECVSRCTSRWYTELK